MSKDKEVYTTDITLQFYPFGDQLKGSSKTFKNALHSFTECFSLVLVSQEGTGESYHIPMASIKYIKIKRNKETPHLQLIQNNPK